MLFRKRPKALKNTANCHPLVLAVVLGKTCTDGSGLYVGDAPWWRGFGGSIPVRPDISAFQGSAQLKVPFTARTCDVPGDTHSVYEGYGIGDAGTRLKCPPNGWSDTAPKGIIPSAPNW